MTHRSVVAHGVSVLIGTPLTERLLGIAEEATAQAKAELAMPADERSNGELQGCLVAILCAHAALEARMNEVGAEHDEWWADRERLGFEQKWADLVDRHTGTRPLRGSTVRNAVKRLHKDRNLIAHFRGVPVPGHGLRVSGPPVSARGGGSEVRAYFNAERAADRLADARRAIEALG
jgi:hypothetical protein